MALVQLNGDIFLFYNKSLGDLNVEKLALIMASATPQLMPRVGAAHSLRTWEFGDYAHYAEWPKVADAVIEAEKFTHQYPRRVDGVDDVGHAYPHSSRHLCDVEIARKLDWRLYKRLF